MEFQEDIVIGIYWGSKSGNRIYCRIGY